MKRYVWLFLNFCFILSAMVDILFLMNVFLFYSLRLVSFTNRWINDEVARWRAYGFSFTVGKKTVDASGMS